MNYRNLIEFTPNAWQINTLNFLNSQAKYVEVIMPRLSGKTTLINKLAIHLPSAMIVRCPSHFNEKSLLSNAKHNCAPYILIDDCPNIAIRNINYDGLQFILSVYTA